MSSARLRWHRLQAAIDDRSSRIPIRLTIALVNYLAHALTGLDQPYFVAGTSVPDWLSVVNRRMRVRSAHATQWLEDEDSRIRSLAAGVIRHHYDDQWFHGTLAFAELSMQFAVELRELLIGDEGFRPSFVGHIAVEMLLDAELIRQDRTLADRFYRALASLDCELVQVVVNKMATATSPHLSTLVPHFVAEGFLYDYCEDDSMRWRLNQVMKRVGLPPLPQTLVPWLKSARTRVALRRDELLSPPSHPPLSPSESPS